MNLANAVTGVYLLLTINYPKVVLSKGSLLVVPDVEMVTSTEAQLAFSWVNNAAAGNTNGSDKQTIVAYNSEKQGYVKWMVPPSGQRLVMCF